MSQSTKKFNWEFIVLLWFAFFFNQADRQVFNIALPAVRDDLGLNDVQLGLIASAFILAIGVFVPIAGYVGDRFSKKTVILLSLLIWSSATFFTGFSGGFLILIILRSIVGGSEAFYAPAANALIGEKFKSNLGHAMAIHQTALYAGIIGSGIIGGYLTEHYGWRMVFYIFGGIGIVLFILMFLRLEDGVARSKEQKVTLLDGIKNLAANRTAVLLTSAFTCMVFVNVGYLTWTSTFLHEKFDLGLTEAGFSSMFYHHAFAFVGVMVAGKLSDRLAGKNAGGRLKIQAWALLLGAPFIFLMGLGTDLPVVYVGLSIFGLFRGMYDSNIYASLFSVVDEKIRASVASAMIMCSYIIGSLAPVVLAYFKVGFGLTNGLASLSLFYVLGSVLIFIALKFTFKKDRNVALEIMKNRDEFEK
ncbi:MFS transporter [Sphingobacterium sp. SGG-5]|uniref:MFS transporter n=1 Tax=Sphingobacterium sp. SGG-5 TaxID=2710881 RepID=UPI0013ED835C|nr:MFS transporter [Sphingobacterium sp. SGG-5]NGM60870.1 MFS transporter [Sphingobacterium sp. SGG-5]